MRITAIAQAHRCNEQIRISPIRLIDEEGNQVGIVSTDDALNRARDAGMDLVEIAPTERPPVCRIMDYGRFKYGQKRHKQKHREQKLKEVRLHPKIGDHDKDRLMKRAIEFLDHGDKVQFIMIFKGRERFHQELGISVMNDVMAQMAEKAKVEVPPRGFGGRMISMVLAPMKHK